MKIKALLLLLVYGCSNPLSIEDPKLDNVQFRVNLPQDANGYYHLKLNSSENQTIHRIDGMVYPPIEYKRFEWRSNLTFDVWQYSVNTTNIRSYTNKYGRFSNVIGPVAEMKGDTMRLVVRWDDKAMLDSIYDYIPSDSAIFYIVLE
jgi:hypothetical protein